MRSSRWLAAAVAAVLALAVLPGSALAEEVSAGSGAVSARVVFEESQERGPVFLEITRAGIGTKLDNLDDPSETGESQWGIFGQRDLIVRDLDGDGEPEIAVGLFSGGAHCCERSVVAFWDVTAGTYRIAVQDWGDASWRLNDLDSDGVPEFVSWDGRWAYWGGSYAESPYPIKIWKFRSGRFVDTTPQHPARVLADMRRQWARFKRLDREGGSVRGTLAAYIADAYSLGRPTATGAAWRRVYAAYQQRDRLVFFRALRAKLAALGYPRPEGPIPPVKPLRRERWKTCRSPAPEIGFIAQLRAQGVHCLLARRLAREIAPGRPPGGSSFYGFRCAQREIEIETIRVRCSRGRFERAWFYTGV